MKFGRYLRDHAIGEWQRAYIRYRVLKKQINKAVSELDQGIITATDAHPEDPAAPNSPRPSHAPYSSSPRSFHRSPAIEAGPSKDSTADNTDAEPEADDEGDGEGPVEERTPRPRAPSHAVGGDREPPVQMLPPPARTDGLGHSPDASAMSGFSNISMFSRSTAGHAQYDSDASGGSQQPLSPSAPPPGTPRSRPHPPQRRRSTYITPANEINPSKWRKPYSPEWPLEKLYATLPPQNRKFFVILDRELERIDGFYSDRLHDAQKRFEELQAQWQELAEHKRAFKEFRERELAPPKILHPVLKSARAVPGANIVRRTLAHRERSFAPTSADSSGPGKRSAVDSVANEADEDRALQRSKVHQAGHARPEDYQSARSKIKLATFEFYRQLGMLKSYKVLNRTGFAKATKKYEKMTRIPAAGYSKKVDAAAFVSDSTLDELVQKVEDAFASAFEGGNRKKALSRLRDFGASESHHGVAWRAGMFMGAGLVLTVEGLVYSWSDRFRREVPYWPALLQLFGALFLPVLFSMCFYLNILAWRRWRINYVLIFELDVRTRLDSHQFIELPAFLFLVWSVCWWAAFSNFWPEHIHPSAYPLVFVVVAVATIFNPFPYFYPSARGWAVRSFSRVLTAGLLRVEFRDFFLGDELVSLYYTFVNFGFVVCTYNHHWAPNVNAVCGTNGTWASPALASIPAGIRLLQSLRRYYDSDGLRIHALNACKYSCSILYYFFYYAWRIRGSRDTWLLVMFILSATVNSLYSFAWDIWMDWGLARRNTKHWMLRAEISAPQWFYYFASVLDLVLRFAWVQYLPALSRTSGAPSVQLRGWLTALLEVVRRIIWNFLRVESEHLGNVDGYRVTRQIPLPYVTLGPNSSPDTASLHDDVDSEAPLAERTLAHIRNVLSWPGQAAYLVGHELHVVMHPGKAKARARGKAENDDSDPEERVSGDGRGKPDPSAPFTPRMQGKTGGRERRASVYAKGEVAESSTDETGGSEGESEREEEDEAWDRVEEGRADEEEDEGEERVGGMAAVDDHERRTGVLG